MNSLVLNNDLEFKIYRLENESWLPKFLISYTGFHSTLHDC